MIPRDGAGRRAQAWWTELQPDPGRNRKGDRAALARLRRCATVTQAMHEPATLALFRAVQADRPGDLPVIGVVAAVLAHVRDDLPGPGPSLGVARLIGPGSLDTPETALLKPLRFRRLMEAEDGDDRLTAFRRLVALAGGKLPVRDLAASLLDWTEARRIRWVFDYWNTQPPADLRDTMPALPTAAPLV